MNLASNLPALLTAQSLIGRANDGQHLFTLEALHVGPGVTLVMGDEGCGKSTLLRLIAGEAPQRVGSAQLAGHDLHRATHAYRSEVAWLDPVRMDWEQTVVNDLWAQQAQHFARWSQATLDDLAEALDLQNHRHKPLYMLSTGSRRKALMAAALSSGAALTLLDMPFAALDGAASRTLREVLADCADHPHRAFVVADYTPPTGVKTTQIVNLDTRTAT